MATIKEKIRTDHDRIMNAGSPEQIREEAKKVGELAIKAIKGGMKSSAWAIYMSRYAENTDQLKRLCGDDSNFNANPWAEECLAYVVGNGVCTITSRRGDVENNAGQIKENAGTLNYLDDLMLDTLNF